MQEYDGDAVVDRENAVLKPGAFGRFSSLLDSDETFYDSYVPTIGDIFDSSPAADVLASAGFYYFILGYSLYGTRFNDWWEMFPFEPKFSGLRRNLTAKYPKRGEDTFGGISVWVAGTGASKFLGGAFPTSVYLLYSNTAAVIEQINRFAFGTGDDLDGKPSIIVFNTLKYGFGHVRGFKYGVFHTKPQPTHAQFRYDTYGQFRDMMEQRLDSRMLVQRRSRKSLTDGPVRCRFVDSDGRSADPSSTPSSNLSTFATSSLPYFDGVSRNRQPIVQAEQGLMIVGV